MASRIAAAGWVVWFYVSKLLLPVGLTTIYPRWQVAGDRLWSFVPLAAWIALLALLWERRKPWGRAPFAVVAYFSITLVPVLGLVAMAWARFSLVADHLLYASMCGIIAGTTALLATPLTRRPRPGRNWSRIACAVLLGGMVCALGAMTWRQAKNYRDRESLWAHATRLNGGSAVAHYNLALAEASRGATVEAIDEFTKAIAVDPAYAEAYNNRGIANANSGARALAIQDFTRAIELKPDYGQAYNNRGGVLSDAGAREQAIRDYDRAIALEPEHAYSYYNRAVAQFALQRYAAAWADVEACTAHGGSVNPAFLRALAQASPAPSGPPSRPAAR